MVAQIFYNLNSPNERQAKDLANELERLKVPTKLIEVDSAEGASLSELYDLTARPAVALVRDDATLVERWQEYWPLATDVSYLAHQ